MPGLWREGWDLVVGHRWELIEDVPQVGQWIDPPPPAALDDRVDQPSEGDPTHPATLELI